MPRTMPPPRPLHYLNVDTAPVGFVAYLKLRQDVGHGARIEQRVHHAATGLDQPADPVGEIIGQPMRL